MSPGCRQIQAASGQWRAVSEHALAALRSDPLQERFHRWMMISAYSQGDRAAALSHFAACQRVLRSQLGVGPDPETLVLRDAIAGGRLALPAVSDAYRQAIRRRLAAILPARLPLIGRDDALSDVAAAVDEAAAGTTVRRAGRCWWGAVTRITTGCPTPRSSRP